MIRLEKQVVVHDFVREGRNIVSGIAFTCFWQSRVRSNGDALFDGS